MPILRTVASGFTALPTPTVEYLVVAGGGGGGGGARNIASGGGGSGGSGIVIIRYSDTFPNATSATVSPTVTSGYRIYTFTANGSITL